MSREQTKKYSIGIDIGGSVTKVVLWDTRAKKITREKRFPTAKNKKVFLRQLDETLRLVLSEGEIIGIGAGLPGIVDTKKGVLVYAPHAAMLNGWDAAGFLKRYHRYVRVDNDSHLAVYTESKLGVGRGYRNVAGLSFGTGVGGGLIIDGNMYHGAHFGAGEFGHMVIDGARTLDELGGKAAFQKHGDQSAIIGKGVANIVNAFDPGIVVLGGGAVASGAVRLGIVRKTARQFIMSPLAKKTPIVKGKLGELAAAIGAAMFCTGSKNQEVRERG